MLTNLIRVNIIHSDGTEYVEDFLTEEQANYYADDMRKHKDIVSVKVLTGMK